jgi:hypothetical protein
MEDTWVRLQKSMGAKLFVIPANAGIHTFACLQQDVVNTLSYGFPCSRE